MVYWIDGLELKKVLCMCYVFISVFVWWWVIWYCFGLICDKDGIIRIWVVCGFIFIMVVIINGSIFCWVDVCVVVVIWRVIILICVCIGWFVDWWIYYVVVMRIVILNIVGGVWVCVLIGILVWSCGVDGFIVCYIMMLWILLVCVIFICCLKKK